MAGKKENPLIGAFRAPVPDASPPDKPGEDKSKGQTQAVIDPKATGTAAPTKADEGKKPTEPPKDAADPKATGAAAPAKADEGKKPAEPPKDTADPKATGTAAPAKADEGKKPAEPPKDAADPKATGTAAPAKADEGKKPAEPSKDTSLRFVPLSKIHDLPGTYVKDQPKADYGDMVKSIKAEGLKEPMYPLSMLSAYLGDHTPLTNQGQERLWIKRQSMKQGVKNNGSSFSLFQAKKAGPGYCRITQTQYLRPG